VVAESFEPISIESIPPTYKLLKPLPVSPRMGCSVIKIFPFESSLQFTLPVLSPLEFVSQVRYPAFGFSTVLYTSIAVSCSASSSLGNILSSF